MPVNKTLLKRQLPALGLICSAFCFSTAATASEQNRQITDMDGTVVSVPPHPASIADLWFAHNEILIMLGAAQNITTSAESPAEHPWLFKIAPALRHARTGVRPGAVSPEELLTQKTDLVFVSGQAQAENLRRFSLTTLDARYVTLPAMLKSLDMTAQALNTAQARETAQHYRQKMEDTLLFLKKRTDTLAEKDKPRVLHIARLTPLQIDGTDTLINSWIEAAGGKNAATVSGNHRPVSFEQIVAWQPDIIIFDPAAGAPDAASPLRSLEAFRSNRWAINPEGVFPWDRYGCEALLQLKWAAKLIHPALFNDVDIRKDTRDFYQDFFRYTLTEDDINRILNAQPPAAL